MRTIVGVSLLSCAAAGLAGCGVSNPTPSPPPDCDSAVHLAPNAAAVPLDHRAYIVSRDSSDLTVIDLDNLEILGNMETCGEGDHMGELNVDFTKIYVDSPGTHESVVVDTRTLQIQKRILLGAETTHISLNRSGDLLGVVNEWDNSVSFVDPVKDVEVKRLGGFYTPHFVRWAPDGKYAYVANLGAYHVSRVDLATLSIDAQIGLDGYDVPPAPQAPILFEQNGFADVQIDNDGVLYAAHGATGRVLVYDTKTRTKLPELTVGAQPWIVYAEHPFAGIKKHVVPNFGDQTVSLINRAPIGLAGVVGGADKESFGVNYSPLVPGRAFVMNRLKDEIAVVNVDTGVRLQGIPVGGNTETASTTADGKYIVAAVSSANRVVVIDAATATVVKAFDNVGKYPWSVTIPNGQNYCH